ASCHHRAPLPIMPAEQDTLEMEISPAAEPSPRSAGVQHPAAKPRAASSPAGSPAAPAQPSCQSAPWRKAGANHAFGAHETFKFEVRWGLLTAGEATVKVQGSEPVRKRPAYHLSTEIVSTGAASKFFPYRELVDSW